MSLLWQTKGMNVFLNNQPDALIIPILFCYKTLHVSDIFSAHHQEFSTVHLALASFMQVFDDRFQSNDGTGCPKHVEFYNRINLDNQCVWSVN